MSTHSREHEERLAALLAGEQGASDAEVTRLLDGCPACRERWEALRPLAARVGAAGADQRALLGELERQAHEPADLTDLLERIAAEEPHGRPRARPGMLAAAAAVLLCMGAWLGARFLGPRPEPTWLGRGLELIAPLAGARSFERFQWSAAEGADSYTLHVYDGTGGERGGLLHEQAKWRKTTWEPAAEIRAKFGREIEWEVEALDAQESSVSSASAFASLSR